MTFGWFRWPKKLFVLTEINTSLLLALSYNTFWKPSNLHLYKIPLCGDVLAQINQAMECVYVLCKYSRESLKVSVVCVNEIIYYMRFDA